MDLMLELIIHQRHSGICSATAVITPAARRQNHGHGKPARVLPRYNCYAWNPWDGPAIVLTGQLYAVYEERLHHWLKSASGFLSTRGQSSPKGRVGPGANPQRWTPRPARVLRSDDIDASRASLTVAAANALRIQAALDDDHGVAFDSDQLKQFAKIVRSAF